jgi:GNAT superfamily N-acetyltransferase
MKFVNKFQETKKEVGDFEVKLKFCRVKYDVWNLFKEYHYLSASLNKSCKCFCAFLDNKPVGFIAVMAQPSGYFKNGWRISRTVVLPDYQGLGIGIAMRNYIGSLVTAKEGARLYSRSMHPAIGLYSEKHPELWQPTSHNKKKQDAAGGFKDYKTDDRPCYSFKYVGPSATQEESELFYEKC